jgi:Spy/CpxP family protein refolding chaperone
MKTLIATLATGCLALGVAGYSPSVVAQENAADDIELLISQIQTDKRAIVLRTLELSDEQLAKFIPIYDAYQAEMKGQFERGAALLDKFGASFGSMDDATARKLMNDWFKLRDGRNEIMRRYSKKMEKVLPATEVLQWVQVENKLNTLLDVQAAASVPLAR